jgi:3-deoxy-D-manno-octulosonic-acid transferase
MTDKQDMRRPLDRPAGAALAGYVRFVPATSTQPTGQEVAGLQLKVYRCLTRLARPLAPALLRLRERQGKEDLTRRRERFGQASVSRPSGRLAWFHAASVGETIAILPLMNELIGACPALSILLTTGTVTSAQLAAERLAPGMIHQYVPLDSPIYVAAFFEHWRPNLAVFTESEIWPNLVLGAAARDIPLALVNARMSMRSFRRWRCHPGLARPLFSRFELVLAQNTTLACHFGELGARRTLAIGNLKVDAPAPPVDIAELEQLRTKLGGRAVWLAASTHEGEDEKIIEAHRLLRRDLPDIFTVIVPRHPERGARIDVMLQAAGLSARRRSLGEMPSSDGDAYVADTIGELGTFYKLAPVSFVGGSLVERGGQNPIEAVRLGSAVLTGPHWQNFRDTYQTLLSHKGAIEVRSAAELASAAHNLLTNKSELERARACADHSLSELSGALARTTRALLEMLSSDGGLRRAC